MQLQRDPGFGKQQGIQLKRFQGDFALFHLYSLCSEEVLPAEPVIFQLHLTEVKATTANLNAMLKLHKFV